VAVQYFLKLDGIEGESKDAQHKGEIDVLSFGWGLTQAVLTTLEGVAGTAKASFQDLHIVKRVDKASPRLFEACASGEHIKDAVLVSRRSGKRPLEFLRYKLSGVIVSSYQIGASAPGAPTDQFSLNFRKIEVEHKAGKAQPVVRAGWDVAANKKL
jgi:type VI secretion system secreted protein Hcp